MAARLANRMGTTVIDEQEPSSLEGIMPMGRTLEDHNWALKLEIARLIDEGRRNQCPECGRVTNNLPAHAYRAHYDKWGSFPEEMKR